MWISRKNWETLNNHILDLSLRIDELKRIITPYKGISGQIENLKKYILQMESKCKDKPCPECPEKPDNK